MSAERTVADRRFDRRAIPAEAKETIWLAGDGHEIRRIDWRAPPGRTRGSLLFMPGRGDSYEKYLEMLHHWHRRGWRVTAGDWRGQAYSGRLGSDAHTGHIDDFALWVEDIALFWARWKAETPPPHVLVGHSMGGHLALRALAEAKVHPAAAVLSTPMLGLVSGFVPLRVMQWAVWLMARIGDSRRPAWKFGTRPGVTPETRIMLLTHDRERYADEMWWRKQRPELAMGAPSWGWMEQAIASMLFLRRSGTLESIDVPVLFLGANHDRLVSFDAIVGAAKRIPRAELVRFGPEARHELLRESEAVRERALSAIDGFLDRTAPAEE